MKKLVLQKKSLKRQKIVYEIVQHESVTYIEKAKINMAKFIWRQAPMDQ